MGRSDLERLSREELIELVLRLQHPDKTSHTSSKPPATDRKEQRAQSQPGGAEPGHEGHSRVLSDDPDAAVEHRPDRCSCCGGASHAELPAEVVSLSETHPCGVAGVGGSSALPCFITDGAGANAGCSPASSLLISLGTLARLALNPKNLIRLLALHGSYAEIWVTP